jgi:hypothetical protein
MQWSQLDNTDMVSTKTDSLLYSKAHMNFVVAGLLGLGGVSLVTGAII